MVARYRTPRRAPRHHGCDGTNLPRYLKEGGVPALLHAGALRIWVRGRRTRLANEFVWRAISIQTIRWLRLMHPTHSVNGESGGALQTDEHRHPRQYCCLFHDPHLFEPRLAPISPASGPEKSIRPPLTDRVGGHVRVGSKLPLLECLRRLWFINVDNISAMA